MELNSPVSSLPLVGPVYARRLEKLDVVTIDDLLHHIPHKYLDFSLSSPVAYAQPGEILTIKGEVTSMKNLYTRYGKKIQVATVADKSGEITAVWFNQPYLVKNIFPGEMIALAGKVDWFSRKKALISPEYENLEGALKSLHTGRLVPIYPETARVSSKWIRGRVAFAYDAITERLDEFLPKELLEKNGFLGFKDAIYQVHFPDNLESAQKGRLRLAFDELLTFQLRSLYRKEEWKKNETVHKLAINKPLLDKFVNSLPFSLTQSQKTAMAEILNDLERKTPMNRLLEGDVGSGKTVVAAAAAFVSFVNGFSTVIMAPTQILAQQHFETLASIFDIFKVRVSLITSAGVTADLGKTDIFVGTHALIHKRVNFENVALVVIDEQHRFGVEQRAHLIKKTGKSTKSPHVLTMTATPIPRTVALTLYADLDLSTLRELPRGRVPITTWVVPPFKREAAYNWIKEKTANESVQAFVVCPLIEESEIETMACVKAATVEYQKLKIVFPKLELGLLHGRQSAKEKNEVLNSFRSGKTNILVSTPVIEVGIDVPNATIMVIEAAERFGLAQLHQLRGRIGRGEKKSYCLLFTESKTQNVRARLSALQRGLSGFELAELDLKLRGPGEMFGLRQHGFPDLKIASWQDIELIKKARELATQAVRNKKKFPKLIKRIQNPFVAPN